MPLFMGFSISAIVMLLTAGILTMWDERREHDAATTEADEYLDMLLEELVGVVDERTMHMMREELAVLDMQEATVSRPEEAWAFIPYVEQALQTAYERKGN